jgi:hypothetical protein
MHNGSSTIQQQENAMGWVVYDEKSGHMQKYYKLASTAKRICTQHNTERTYDWGRAGAQMGVPNYRYSPERIWAYCSYRDYEGVLMGLRGDALKVWQFCNTQTG